jgi:hypothetical protein
MDGDEIDANQRLVKDEGVAVYDREEVLRILERIPSQVRTCISDGIEAGVDLIDECAAIDVARISFAIDVSRIGLVRERTRGASAHCCCSR